MAEPTTSAEIGELAAALSKAQGAIEDAEKTRENPFFKSRYATLAAVWAACRAPLAANGLAVAQPATSDGARVTVTTLLLHSSGQWLRSDMSTQAKDAGPQSVGSAVSYLRRYLLAAMVGVATEDDDAEGATDRSKKKERQESSTATSSRATSTSTALAPGEVRETDFPMGDDQQAAPPVRTGPPLPSEQYDQAHAALNRRWPGDAGKPSRLEWWAHATGLPVGDAKTRGKFLRLPADERAEWVKKAHELAAEGERMAAAAHAKVDENAILF